LFIDDSPPNTPVGANAPEVLTIHLNGDAAYHVRRLDSACAFDQLTLTSKACSALTCTRREQHSLRSEVKTWRSISPGSDCGCGLRHVTKNNWGG
jgi:hypothetical protein